MAATIINNRIDGLRTSQLHGAHAVVVVGA
jgi:hypothetical protein